MRFPSRLVRALALAGGALIAAAALAACGADPNPTPLPPHATATPFPAATATPLPPRPTATATPRPRPTATATPEPEPAGPSLPATVTDVSGDEVVVDDVSRIVALNGDFTEVVFALGLGANVVAVDASATYPREALRLPKVGYQRMLSAEGILAMEPSVVIGSVSAGPAEVIDQVRSTGVPVVILDAVSTIEGIGKKIRGVAQALGVPERGEEIAAQVEAEVAEVRALAAQAEERPTAAFIYLRGRDTVLMGGTGDLSHELFEASGATSAGAVAGIRAPWVPLTAEALVSANPDCLVLFTAGLESIGGVDGLMGIPGVAQTNAAAEGCILDFEGQYLQGGGPRAGALLRELLAAFHPELADGR